MEEENEMNNEQLDFLCSFLHKSIYKSLISENFLDFNENLLQEFPSFEAKLQRKELLEEIKTVELLKNNEKAMKFIEKELNSELNSDKIEEKIKENVCNIF